jgi:hypothetical protein
MSGGAFNYREYVLGDIAEELDRQIHSETRTYSEQFIQLMRKKKRILEDLEDDLKKIDKVISGDLSEESYFD